MIRELAIITVFLCSISFVRAETVSLSGTVKKTGGSAGIAGVKVSLAKLTNLTATTDAEGAFTITETTPVLLQQRQPAPLRFFLKGNAIVISPSLANIVGSIEFFSSDGKRRASFRQRTIEKEIAHLK